LCTFISFKRTQAQPKQLCFFYTCFITYSNGVSRFMKNARQLTEGAMLGGIYLVLLLIAIYVPFIGMVAYFVLPVPIILYWLRHGIKPSLTFSAAILLFSIIASSAGVLTTLAIAIGASMTGYALHHKQSTYEALLKGTVGYALGATIFWVLTQAITGINIIDAAQTTMQESMQEVRTQMNNLGVTPPEDRWTQVTEMIDYIFVLVPTLIAVYSFLYAFVTQWLAQKVHNRKSKEKILYPPFRRFNLPVIVLFIYFIGSFARWFDIDPNGGLYPFIVNITELAGILLIIQGFAFMFYFAYERKLAKVFPILTVIFSILLGPILLYLVRILGIIDIGFRLRERLSSKK
jgi:uncharacterized protein YybS (DUF2232 family)